MEATLHAGKKSTPTLSPFSQSLVQSMESYCRYLLVDVPIFREAKNGRVTNKELTWYLFNLKFLLSRTDQCMVQARNRSLELGLGLLADFYADKRQEEAGHEAWANDDLATRQASGATFAAPSKHFVELMKFIPERIHANPTGYLGYVLLTEFVTVAVGSAWLADLERHCGISMSSMSSVSKHVELDKHHILDDFAIIDAACTTEQDRRDVAHVIQNGMKYFEGFAREIEIGSFA